MIAEAIRAIQQLADAAGKVQIISPPAADRQTWYGILNPKSGEIECCEVEAGPRAYEAYTLDDLVRLARRMADGAGEQALLFVGHGGATLVLGEGDDQPKETAAINLDYSHAYSTLLGLAAERGEHDQAEFARLLRVDLNGCLLDGGKLLGQVRNLRFEKNAEGASSIAPVGTQAVSREVRMRMISGDGGELPELIDLQVKVYEQVEQVSHVKCALDVDVERGTFLLIPLAGELDQALRDTDAGVAKFLAAGVREVGIEVVCGSDLARNIVPGVGAREKAVRRLNESVGRLKG